MKNNRFGIEIEFSKIHEVDPSIYGYDGEDIVYYHHPLFSIGCDAPNFEVRSTILNNVGQAKQIVDAIKQLGCYISGNNHFCGLHVHIDRGPINKEILNNKIKIFMDKNYEKIMEEFKPLKSRLQFCSGKDGFDPNAMIFIHNLYNTLEFRIFDSIIDEEYVAICIDRSKQWMREIYNDL